MQYIGSSLEIDDNAHNKNLLYYLLAATCFLRLVSFAWTSSAVRIRTIIDKLVINDLLELRNCTSAKTANVWAKAFL